MRVNPLSSHTEVPHLVGIHFSSTTDRLEFVSESVSGLWSAFSDDRVPDRHPIATRSSPDRLRYCSENACKTNSTDQKSTDSEGYGHGLLGRVTEVVPSLVFRFGRQHQVSCLVLLFLPGKRQLRNSLISACERTFQPY